MIISMFAEATAGEPQKWLWNLVGVLAQKNQENTAAYIAIYVLGIVLCMAVPYLLGSINPAILISKYVYHEDIRSFGSGNAGSTNMLRTYGKKAAAATFLIDLLKAAVACFFGLFVMEMNGLGFAGFFVILGHMFPVFQKFRGGKGVASLAMVALITSIMTNNWLVPFVPFAFLFLLLAFLIIAVGTRYVSLASVTAALLYPVLISNFSNPNQAGICVAMAVLSSCFVIIKHIPNLKRIYHRTESQLSFKKTSKKKTEDYGKDDGKDGRL